MVYGTQITIVTAYKPTNITGGPHIVWVIHNPHIFETVDTLETLHNCWWNHLQNWALWKDTLNTAVGHLYPLVIKRGNGKSAIYRYTCIYIYELYMIYVIYSIIDDFSSFKPPFTSGICQVWCHQRDGITLFTHPPAALLFFLFRNLHPVFPPSQRMSDLL